MPLLVRPALPAGAMRALAQPRLAVHDRLVLRPWRDGDAPAVRAAFDCPDIQRWHVRRMDSDAEARDWIAGWAGRWAAERDASWAIAGAGDDRALGQVGLREVVLAEAQAQVSYWILPAARGRGVAAAATGAVRQWAFDTLRLHRLALLHSTANLPSCRVAHKAGFRLEGTLRGHLLHADGWHDTHLHARLRTDG
jgi:ribosomal-protein-alanine N-acetyltransferase